MCGGDFDILHTGPGGRDVYGKRHEGRDYLFFPLSFRPVDAGLLSLDLPASYEDHPFDAALHGARVRFMVSHGSAFFPEMPEEYWSDAGVLHVSESGVRVRLDKLDPAQPVSLGGCSCGCGHSHAHETPAHHRTGSAHTAHTHGTPHTAHAPHAADAPHAMNERELASAIRSRAAELNSLLELAAKAGLAVDIGLDDSGAKVSVRRVMLLL